MFQKFAKIKGGTREFRDRCENLLNFMQPDVSSYARGRYRLWLFHEAILGKKEVRPAYFDKKIWDFAQKVYPEANIALLTYNGATAKWTSVGTIKPHRDDTYAQDKAVGINLGSATFSYNQNRYSCDVAAMEEIQLNDGDIYLFNCKHLHAVSAASSGRFSLNIWKIKEDPRYPKLKPTIKYQS